MASGSDQNTHPTTGAAMSRRARRRRLTDAFEREERTFGTEDRPGEVAALLGPGALDRWGSASPGHGGGSGHRHGSPVAGSSFSLRCGGVDGGAELIVGE